MIEPGIYADMSNDDYHGDRDYLSSTYIKTALPERYKPATGESPALAFGTLVHEVILEPDQLDKYVGLDAHAIAGDNPKTGRPYDAPHMTARFKARVAEVEAEGFTVVTAEDWDRAQRMAESVKAHPIAGPLIFGSEGVNEESVFAADDDCIHHKARFDRRIPGAIIDVKTTSAKPGADSLARAVIDYGYDLSAAHYLEVAKLADLDADTFTFVFVGKEPDRDGQHPVTVADLDDDFLTRGRVLRALALERLTNPDAPRYEGADAPLTLRPPGWARLVDPDTAIPADFTWSINDYA